MAIIGAGFSLETRKLLAVWFDRDSKRQCPDTKNALGTSGHVLSLIAASRIPDGKGGLVHPEGLVEQLKALLRQTSPCPHKKDYPGCLFPEIHELDARVDLYKATRPDPSDDDALREWLTSLDAWVEEGGEILHDHPDEVGANLLDLALQEKGWDGWTLRKRITEVLKVMGDLTDKLYPPARGRGHPGKALLGLVGDAVQIAERAGASGDTLTEILTLVLVEAGEFGRPRKKGDRPGPLTGKTVRKHIAEARRRASDV